MSSWTVRQGDALEALAELPAASADAVVTDPPYIVGAISVGHGTAKAGTWADMENAAYWFAAWMAQAKRVLKPTGYLLCFGNWRSIPTLIRALALAELPATSCLVWDKQWIGPAGPAQLRPRFEVVMFSGMPEAKIPDRSAPDILACKWMAGNMRETNHAAEKPVALLRRLIELVVPPGGHVVDPFTGSGTTGCACLLEGRTFHGIEREPAHVETARARLAATAIDASRPAPSHPFPETARA